MYPGSMLATRNDDDFKILPWLTMAIPPKLAHVMLSSVGVGKPFRSSHIARAAVSDYACAIASVPPGW